MCTYTQREYSCGHFRWIATEHCLQYTRGEPQMFSNCEPDINEWQTRDFVCGECKHQLEPLKHAHTDKMAWWLFDRR